MNGRKLSQHPPTLPTKLETAIMFNYLISNACDFKQYLWRLIFDSTIKIVSGYVDHQWATLEIVEMPTISRVAHSDFGFWFLKLGLIPSLSPHCDVNRIEAWITRVLSRFKNVPDSGTSRYFSLAFKIRVKFAFYNADILFNVASCRRGTKCV